MYILSSQNKFLIGYDWIIVDFNVYMNTRCEHQLYKQKKVVNYEPVSNP